MCVSLNLSDSGKSMTPLNLTSCMVSTTPLSLTAESDSAVSMAQQIFFCTCLLSPRNLNYYKFIKYFSIWTRDPDGLVANLMTLSLHLNASRVIRVRLKSILKDGKSPTSSSSATSWCASCATCATSWRACCTTSAPSTRPASRQCQVDLATFSTAAAC